MTDIKDIPSSFRDPSGVLFLFKNQLYRRIHNCYKEDYDRVMDSGLYETLIKDNLLIPHDEVTIDGIDSTNIYKIIKPEFIDFISHPYEWSFSQLKDAALLTLKIQKTALDYGMSLKDCSAYNIQFVRGRPIFIDTLSFERYKDGRPWVAYRQFCQHFLAPLALMGLKDVRLNQFMRIYIDGIPLDLTSSLLPVKTWMNFGILFHIHLHARSQKRYKDRFIKKEKYRMSRSSLISLIDNLISSVRRLRWSGEGTEWSDYYKISNYSERAMESKVKAFKEIIDSFEPGIVWDLGANDGFFSRIIAKKAIYVISFDMDPACVEKNYLKCKEDNEKNILPLLMDLTNPSPDIGWQNTERMSFLRRSSADTVVALALIHHLCISNNIPFEKLAIFFKKISHFLIIEFIPETDSQVKRLMSCMDIDYPNYTREVFEKVFSKYFFIHKTFHITESERIIYFMEKISQDDK